MQISALRSLSHPLNAPANPLAARVTAALHAPALRSSAEHLGEEAGREVVAVMHATHIHIEVTTNTHTHIEQVHHRSGCSAPIRHSLPPLRRLTSALCHRLVPCVSVSLTLSRRRSG